VAALALGGPLTVVRAWLEKFAIWLVYASTAAIAIALILKGPDIGARHAPFSGVASLLLALDLVIAMPVSWWPLISDYNRFARSSKDSIVGTAAGYTIANTLFYMLGAGLGGGYEGFLFLIGGLFVPLLGVVIADSFVVRRGSYAPNEFFEGAPRWRWSAFASWIPGAVLYFVIVAFALPIGATLPSFALAAGLHILLSRVESALTRPTSVAASGDP